MQPATHTSPHSQGSAGRAVFFALLVFEIVFLMAARTPVDSDLWWHLATGEQTLRSGWPVLADTFSYTRAGAPWTNHSWLAEVILALTYRAGGWMGVSALVALLAEGPAYHRFTPGALTDPNGFTGVNGIFRFNADGTSERGLAVLEVTPDGFHVVSPAPKTFQARS